MSKSRHNAKQSVVWIYNPWLDLIVGCGAWSAPLLLVSYASLASKTLAWSVAFYALALIFNYPHYMATIYRAYHEDFQKYRIFTVHVTAVMVLTLVLSHVWSGLLPWIFTIYLTWSPWHYSGQNYGLFMMFARRAGADPDPSTRRALYGAFIVSYLVLFLGFHTGPSNDPLFISLGMPAAVSRWEQVILSVAFVVLSVFGLSRLVRATGWRKLVPSLTLFSSQFLWFLLPSVIAFIKGWEIPQSRYSSGVLAVMHSAQYLWITSYYARREATNDSADKRSSSWRPLGYFGVLVVGGIALFVPGPWLASRAFHHDFTGSFLIFTALVNIHHFILDGAIWKLRDGRIASLLLNSRERIADAAAQAGGRLGAAGRWFAGSTVTARSLRVTAASLLLIWGTVDQARYYLALRSDDLQDLKRAAVLDAFDSPLQVHLANKELEDGQPQQAEAAWRRALQSNPANLTARQNLLRFLIGQKRIDEAYILADASLKYSPKDANLLFDRGLLAQQRGHSDQAIADWNEAITIDPSQTLPHLYLASELDREGNPALAASHYRTFLEKLAQTSAQNRPAPEEVIAVLLRMADCQARSSQNDLAVKAYQLAGTVAVETHQPKLESVADVNEAAIRAKTGRLSDALQLYQHALQLDQSTADGNASVADWLAYGHFLDNQGFPSRLAYACLVKANNLNQSAVHAPLPAYERSAREQLEKRLGSSAAAIQRNPEPLLEEALALRR